MSNDQFAFLRKQQVPSRHAWQEAIDEAGFEFTLDEALEPFGEMGYRPCKLFGADAGFEIFYSPASEILEDLEDLSILAADRDICITMSWGGDMRDCASVMIASYALAKNFGAVVSYQGDEPVTTDQLLQQTKEVVELARNDS